MKFFNLAGITHITDEIAQCFVNMKARSLDLSGILELSASVADILSNFRSESLSLEGLRCLSEEGSESLSKFQGYLNLMGIQDLSDAAIHHLTKQLGLLLIPDVQSSGIRFRDINRKTLKRFMGT